MLDTNAGDKVAGRTEEPEKRQEARPRHVPWGSIEPAALGQDAKEARGVEVQEFGQLPRAHGRYEAHCQVDLRIPQVAKVVMIQEVKEVEGLAVGTLGECPEQLHERVVMQSVRGAEDLWPQETELGGRQRRGVRPWTPRKHALVPLLKGDEASLRVQ
eukprot:CAMPEP_0171065562 /NCGR_PEP_ID=MMETSP0766_2-20121228/6917_1 /TAXON_ID=439317 /ORGANISM="Gambierdiscus australes, Strain CAWD 149" /LENGTH=157 /DNA_ID=CAMNT_0011521673 /DNA_START=296 /DNA_END=769 /DNA_ORIENTATION=+